MIERIYRRDEPSSAAWISAAKPSRAIFRGMFVLKAAFLVACAAVFAWFVHLFSSLPAGEIRARHAACFVAALAGIELAEIVATGFVRDFVAPVVSLRGVSFGAALRESVRASGFWLFRYLCLAVPLSLAAHAAAAVAVVAVFGIFGNPASLTPLFSIAFAFAAMPWHLIHALWALDIVFSRDPSLRHVVPPEASAGSASGGKPPRRGIGRYDRGAGGNAG